MSTDNDQANSTQYLPWLSQPMTPPIQSHTPEAALRHDANVDGVFNYACSTLFLGMVVKQLTDSVHEGDAEREELCWKLMLLLFKVKINNRNRTKYAHVAIKYLCLIKALLTPRMAHKLKWGRYFNDTGRPGGCIPIDQRVEHEVRDVKDHFDRLGRNLNETSAQRFAHSQTNSNEMLKNIDKGLGVTPQSKGHNTISSDSDVEIMVKELLQRDVFSEVPGRSHPTFPNQPHNILDSLNMGDVRTWMRKLIKKFSNAHNLYGASELDSDESDSDDDTDN